MRNLGVRSAIPSIISLLILSASTTLPAFTFDSFTDKSMKFKLVQQINSIWIATNGGAIRWDMKSETAMEYTTIQGLSDNYCTFVGLDSTGKVWLRSSGGFDGFDGQSWHPIVDTSGLLNRPDGSRFMLSGPQGRKLYTFSCTNGHDTVNGSVVKLSSATDTFSDTLDCYYLFKHTHVDVAGRLWVPFIGRLSSSLQPLGYSMFDGTAWHNLPDSVDPVRRVLDITTPVLPIAGGAGRFIYPFQRIDGNIDTVDCGNWEKFIAVKDSLCIPPSMTIDTAGRLWIGTAKGLVRCDVTGPREYDFRSGPLGMYPSALVEDTRGTLWVLGDGIARYDGTTWTYPEMKWQADTSFRLSSRMIPSSTDSGGMWFKSNPSWDATTTWGNGIAYYNGRSWDEIKVYTKNDGLTSDVIVDMAVDRDNALWCICGGDSPSLCNFANNTWTCRALPDSLKGELRRLYIDRKNNIWLIANNPARSDGTNWQVFPITLYEGRAGCDPLFEDSKGNIWFGTFLSGLYRYDGTSAASVKIYTYEVPGQMVTALGEDSSGALWAGFGCDWTGGGYTNCQGLWRHDETGWKIWATANAGFDLVTTMLCDRTGAMWFGCAPGVAGGVSGVSRFDGTHWQKFSIKDGLSDPRVSSMYTAKNGDIWFLSYNGVSRLKSSELSVGVLATGQPGQRSRTLNSKVFVTSGFRPEMKGPAVYYDIRGRRVNLYQDFHCGLKVPAASGIYIVKYPKGMDK
jgi:ligand-binding sensor domain-containing protein